MKFNKNRRKKKPIETKISVYIGIARKGINIKTGKINKRKREPSGGGKTCINVVEKELLTLCFQGLGLWYFLSQCSSLHYL